MEKLEVLGLGCGEVVKSKELASGALKVSQAKPTFKAVKEQIKATNPDLSSAKVKVLAEQAMQKMSGEFDSAAVAVVVESAKRGFHVDKIDTTEMKSGRITMSIKSSKPAPKAAKAKTKAELLKEMEELKAQLAEIQAPVIEG